MGDGPQDLEGWFEAYFARALKDLNPSSSVGMCSFRHYGNTVEEALGGNPRIEGDANPERVEMLKQMTYLRLRNISKSDPIRIFVKHEPHKLSKLEEERYRLISAVSLVDAMADRILFIWLSSAILDNAGTNSMAIGWSPMAGGYRWVMDTFRGGRGTRGLDMTAWDWTMPEWLILAIKDVIQELAVCAPEFWRNLVEARWESLFRDAWFCFGDGSVVQQPGWGLMKSGCFLTIIMNTLSQLVRHVLVCNSLGINWEIPRVFLGDDQTIEDFPMFGEYERETRRLGFLLKDSVVSVDRVHFAGFVMDREGAVPEYQDKHVYLITHTPDDQLAARLESYQVLYAHHSGFYEWVYWELARVSPALVIKRWQAKDIFAGRRLLGQP